MSDKKIATEVLRLVKKRDVDVPSRLGLNGPYATVQLKYKSLKEGIYTIPPQNYNSLKKLGKNDLKNFYNYKGKAVTGTGADVWILADKKAVNYFSLKGKFKKYDVTSGKSKSRKKVKKTAGSKSRKKVKKTSKRSQSAMMKIKRNEKKISAMFKLGRHPRRPKSCSRQYSKIYTSRKSPPYPANECCGHYILGNDDKSYVSKMASNGVCKWVRDYTPSLY